MAGFLLPEISYETIKLNVARCEFILYSYINETKHTNETGVKMKSEIKDKLYGTNHLQGLLGISRAQAWRIWNGKSKLTKQNEELLIIKLELNNNARKSCELAADKWVEEQRLKNENDNIFFNKIVGARTVSVKKYIVNCDDTMDFLNDLKNTSSIAKHDITRDSIMDVYFKELEKWIVSTNNFLIEEYK